MGILIVDDSDDTRRSTRMLLEMAGFSDVLTAASARDAFRLLDLDGSQAVAVDAILMDVTMPQMDGLEACRQLKANARLRDIPVIMVTGRTEEADLAAAFEAGAMDYITKPIKIVELLARLRSALTLKHELDNRKARQLELLELTRQLRDANQRLERLSTQDPLTGIANRRSFQTTLSREWGRAVREAAPVSLVMIDVDHFKGYNDHYGHPRGDEVLRKVAQTLRGQLKRPGDLLARYGGEEFVTLLTHTGMHGARLIADALRSSIEDLGIEHAESPLHVVTISVGVATMVPDRHTEPDALVQAADQALYEAKRSGRNRVMTFDRLPDYLKRNVPVQVH